MMETKKCRKCGIEKEVIDFLKRETGVLRNECKECHNEYQRIRYLEKLGKFKRTVRAEKRETDPKRCVKCGEIKPLSEFTFHDREKGQHRNFCHECEKAWIRKYHKSPQGKEKRKEWVDQNKEKIEEYKEVYRNDPKRTAKSKVYHRKYRLMNEFGLTPDDYDEILKKQQGRCAVCRTDRFHSRRKTLAVDHDHVTNKVRGLLCRRCNQAIGAFEDNPDLLRKAATYLETI